MYKGEVELESGDIAFITYLEDIKDYVKHFKDCFTDGTFSTSTPTFYQKQTWFTKVSEKICKTFFYKITSVMMCVICLLIYIYCETKLNFFLFRLTSLAKSLATSPSCMLLCIETIGLSNVSRLTIFHDS